MRPAIDERFVRQPVEGLAQLGGSVDDQGLERDDRRGPALAGGVASDLGVADHLYEAVG